MSARAARRAALAKKEELNKLLDDDETFVAQQIRPSAAQGDGPGRAAGGDVAAAAAGFVAVAVAAAPSVAAAAAANAPRPQVATAVPAAAVEAVAAPSGKKRRKTRGSRGGDRKRHKPYQMLSWEEKLQLQDAELRSAAAAVSDREARVPRDASGRPMAAPNAPRHTTSEIIGLADDGARSGARATRGGFAAGGYRGDDGDDVRGIDAAVLAQLAGDGGSGDAGAASAFPLRGGDSADAGTGGALPRRGSRRDVPPMGPTPGDGGGVPWLTTATSASPSGGGDTGAAALVAALRAEVRRLNDRVVAAEAEAAALRRGGAGAAGAAVGTPIGACPTCGARTRRKRGRS